MASTGSLVTYKAGHAKATLQPASLDAYLYPQLGVKIGGRLVVSRFEFPVYPMSGR